MHTRSRTTLFWNKILPTMNNMKKKFQAPQPDIQKYYSTCTELDTTSEPSLPSKLSNIRSTDARILVNASWNWQVTLHLRHIDKPGKFLSVAKCMKHQSTCPPPEKLPKGSDVHTNEKPHQSESNSLSRSDRFHSEI